MDQSERDEFLLPPLQNTQTQIDRETPMLMSTNNCSAAPSQVLDRASNCFRSTITNKFDKQLKQNIRKVSNIANS